MYDLLNKYVKIKQLVTLGIVRFAVFEVTGPFDLMNNITINYFQAEC